MRCVVRRFALQARGSHEPSRGRRRGAAGSAMIVSRRWARRRCDHERLRAKLADDLAARAAGQLGRGRRGVDGHRPHVAFAGGGRGKNRGALGAIAQAVRGILDVAAGVDSAGTGEHGRADPEFRIRGVRRPGGGAGGLFEAANLKCGDRFGHVRARVPVSRRQTREGQTPSLRGCAPR